MKGISRVSAIVGRDSADHGPVNTNLVALADRDGDREGKMSRLKSLSPPSDHLSSSSSLSTNTTDSDTSLKSINQDTLLIANQAMENNNHIQQHNSAPALGSSTKAASKILIKYNYYDYNGSRQEQTNQDMNYYALHERPANNKGPPANNIQRQLSPTFKESIEKIVKNTQQAVEAANRSSVSPEAHKPAQSHQLQLTRRYKLWSYEQRCLRCNKTVYQMDKVGPLRDFTFYHQNCFKCRECGTKLTLKTYYNNQRSSTDQEVYCHNHCPKTNPGKLDNQSVGILAALNAPKVFDALAGNNAAMNEHGPGNGRGSPTGAGAGAGGAGGVASLATDNGSPNVDSRALYIQHAVQQTRLQNMYKNKKQHQQHLEHHHQHQHQHQQQQQQHQQQQVASHLPEVDGKQLSQLINRRLEFLEPKQKLLEMRHREEEDALFKAFEMKWLKEESCISEQIRQEWQVELGKLLDKYKRQLSSISANQHQHPTPIALSQHELLKLARADLTRQQQTSEQQMIEFERLNLEKSMTIKLDRKKETLKRKLKEFERQATAELVEKQSREMLALISIKLDEYKEEQKRKIGADLEQFEAIDSLANQLGSTLRLGAPSASGEARNSAQVLLNEAPAPRPPQISKMELYNNEEPDVVFRGIDELAINVARADQRTFTDLVHHLTRDCITDVEKARAIFRWITVKNLNTMHFDASVKPDTPLGLLRGIKNGSESYHVLFKRLCSYAGLHCVVIKGYSKSAGYQPGVRFEGNRFRNSWNAVFVAGAWRFVQCNWGARHLVSVAVMQDKSQQQATKAAAPADLMNGRGGTPAAPTAGLGPANRSLVGLEAPTSRLVSPGGANYGRRGMEVRPNAGQHHHSEQVVDGSSRPQQHSRKHHKLYQSPGNAGSDAGSSSSSSSPTSMSSSSSSSSPSSSPSHGSGLSDGAARHQQQPINPTGVRGSATTPPGNDSLRYEYDDHYFLTDPDEFIYEFYPLSPEWQLIKSRPITVTEFEQLPFVRSLFFKYGLYFPQHDIRSVLYTDSSGATTIKIGMPTHMIPTLIFHYNLKYYHSDAEHYEGVSLKRFVMQSIESGTCESSNGQTLLSNIVSFRVHLPENGAYILDIFANSTVPSQYTSGEPMKFKSVCKFKVIAKNLKTVMIPLPDCASGEYGPMKATRSFGLIPITHENGLIVVKNEKRFLEIQFRMTRSLLDFMASLHKNGYDEKLLSKSIKIFIESDIVHVTIKFTEDGQYGLDLYTRDSTLHHQPPEVVELPTRSNQLTKDGRHLPDKRKSTEANKQLLTHCCKYLINVKTAG